MSVFLGSRFREGERASVGALNGADQTLLAAAALRGLAEVAIENGLATVAARTLDRLIAHRAQSV